MVIGLILVPVNIFFYRNTTIKIVTKCLRCVSSVHIKESGSSSKSVRWRRMTTTSGVTDPLTVTGVTTCAGASGEWSPHRHRRCRFGPRPHGGVARAFCLFHSIQVGNGAQELARARACCSSPRRKDTRGTMAVPVRNNTHAKILNEQLNSLKYPC